VELHEFHVLQRQAGAQHHGIAVAGAGMRRGAREEGAAIAAGCQDRFLRTETVQRAVIEFPGRHAAADAFLIHDQVKRDIFDEELGLFAHALAVQCVEHGVAGPVSGRTGALHGPLAEVACHAAKGALVDLAFVGAREGHAPVLKLVNGGRCLATEIFDRVLVAEPVGSLDGVIHVPAPVILAHIAERSGDAALCGHRVRPGRENLGDTGRLQSGLGRAQSRAKARAACADYDNVVRMVYEFVIGHLGFSRRAHQAPAPIHSFRTDSATVTNSAITAKLFRIRSAVRVLVLAI